MLNLNDVGRPLAKIVGGKYDNKVISVTVSYTHLTLPTIYSV